MLKTRDATARSRYDELGGLRVTPNMVFTNPDWSDASLEKPVDLKKLGRQFNDLARDFMTVTDGCDGARGSVEDGFPGSVRGFCLVQMLFYLLDHLQVITGKSLHELRKRLFITDAGSGDGHAVL